MHLALKPPLYDVIYGVDCLKNKHMQLISLLQKL